MTQTLNEPSKISKNRRNVKFWKIRMQKQISSWTKELSITDETGKVSDNGKLNRKKRKIFQKYRVTNAREVAQLIETLKQKVQAKAQRIRRYEKMEIQSSQNKTFNLLSPNDDYSRRTTPLTSKCCILHIYSTNIGTEYFKRDI